MTRHAVSLLAVLSPQLLALSACAPTVVLPTRPVVEPAQPDVAPDITGLYLGMFHRDSGGASASYPVVLSVSSDRMRRITGTLHWPTLQNSITRIEGKDAFALAWTETELIQGGGVVLNGRYVASLKKDPPGALEGRWSPPANAEGQGREGGTFVLRPLSLVMESCDKGGGEDCAALADLYMAGRGVAQDLKVSVDYTMKACQAGERRSCGEIVAVLGEKCGGDRPAACGLLGSLYEEGKLVPRDVARALDLYQRGCGRSDGRSCGKLGALKWHGDGVPQDRRRGLALMQQGCSIGFPEGCGAIGLIHLKGEGVPRSPGLAVPLLRQACEGGRAASCAVLGDLYLKGDGVEEDAGQAAGVLQKGCDGDEAQACLTLASLYTSGRGVAKDLVRGFSLMGKAVALNADIRRVVMAEMQRKCDTGDPLTCFMGGMVFAEGKWGVKQDGGLAAKMLDRACTGDVPPACTRLGHLYREGTGVPADPGKALFPFLLACQKKDGEGCAFAAMLVVAQPDVLPGGRAGAREAARGMIQSACSYGYKPACRVLPSSQ